MGHRSSQSGPSQRQLRVGEVVRHTLADILTRGDLQDPGLSGRVVTVSEVRVSPDLKHATAFVAALGGSGTPEVIAALTRCRKYLRGELGRRMTTKFTPELRFEADQSFDEAERVEGLLRSREVARDLDHDAPDEDAEDGEDEDRT